MTVYELMIKTNYYLIKGGLLLETQKKTIINNLLTAKSNDNIIYNFKKSVKAPEYYRSLNQSNDLRVMYPLFFIPPFNNGKKLQSVIPMSPKTHILAANSYELEIIRILYLFAPDNLIIKEMVDKTLKRLKTTCFGYHDCHHGECFHSALIVLRFINTTSNDLNWLKKLIEFFNNYNGETYRHTGTLWYYWLCLSELPIELAEPEIKKHEKNLLIQLKKKEKNKNEEIPFYNIICNCLKRLNA